MEYLEEVEADFLSFYHIFDVELEPQLDGPRFIRLASQLPRYQGAVRNRLEYEAQKSEGSGVSTAQSEPSEFTPGQTMSMGEALARSKGSDIGVLNALSQDSKSAGLGDLFEYETG